MSGPNRNNPYSFDDFLAWRNGVDYYFDDPIFRKVLEHLSGSDWEGVDAELKAM